MMGTDDATLRIERIIDCDPSTLYAAWTTREAMEHWYQDQPGWNVAVTELDVVVGGSYRVEWGPIGAAPYVEYGRYLELDPPRRIVMTETLEAGDQSPWVETRVTVELFAEGDKTRLVLVHEGFPSPEARNDAAGGWPHFLDRLEQYARKARQP